MRSSGTLHIGEASSKAAKAMSRFTGHPWPLIWSNAAALVFVFAVIFGFSALSEAYALPSWGWLIALMTMLVGGVWVTMAVCRRLAVRAFKAALAARNVSDPLPVVIEIADGHLLNQTGEVETRTAWRAVSEILRIEPYWVILAQGGAHYVPRRYFGDIESEKAFVSAILARLTDEARARSDAARAFALG